MPSHIPDNHIAKPHLRMRISGKTRFHEAIEATYSSDRLQWLEVAACPYNRRSRDKSHPLLAAVKRLIVDLKKPADELGEMPIWWKDIYKNDTKEDWIRKQTERDERTLSESRLVFEKCLINIDWADWKSTDVGAVLNTIPLSSFAEDERNKVMDRLLEGGLPIDRLRYNGSPVTPAMWSLLSTPYAYSLEGWLVRDIPLDPPGNKHAGLLSAILFSWKRTSSSFQLNVEQHLELAFAKGARVDLPVAPGEWVDEEHKKNNRLFTRDDEHLKMKTALGQAQALKEPELVTLISKHADISDDDRIDSIKVLMRQTAEVWGRGSGEKKNEETRRKHFEQLWKLLQEPARDRKKWRAASNDLLSGYFQDLWTRVSVRHEPRVVEVLDLMAGLGVDLNAAPGRTTWEDQATCMSWSMTLAEAVQAMDIRCGALSKCPKINPRDVGNAMAVGFVRRAFSERFTNIDKMIRMAQHALSMGPIEEATSIRIQETLFAPSSSGISTLHIQSLIGTLEDSGWKATSRAWEILRERFTKPNSHDSAEVIGILAEVAARHAVPTSGRLFHAPGEPPTDQNPARSDGYLDICDWGHPEALEAHMLIVRHTLPLLSNINDTQWCELKKSPLHLVASHMERGLDPTLLAHMDAIADLLLKGGAHPSREINPETKAAGGEWIEEISPGHAFHGTWARWSKEELDQQTPSSLARPRARRI